MADKQPTTNQQLISDKQLIANKPFKRLGFIGRFRPLHNGAVLALETLCSKAEHVIIGIGSTNKYNVRNPFYANEVEDMINLVLQPKYTNYEIVKIPDFAQEEGCEDGHRWVQEIRSVYKDLDAFISGNQWTNKLLEPHYKIIHPSEIIPKEQWIYCKGSMVRMAMARDENWQQLVRPQVANYLKTNHLVERFQREFGLETIATLSQDHKYDRPEGLDEELQHPKEKSRAPTTTYGGNITTPK